MSGCIHSSPLLYPGRFFKYRSRIIVPPFVYMVILKISFSVVMSVFLVTMSREKLMRLAPVTIIVLCGSVFWDL